MDTPQQSPKGRFPIIPLALAAAALAVFLLKSDSESGGSFTSTLMPFAWTLNALVPGLFVVGCIGLVWGLVKYFHASQSDAKKGALHVVYGALALLIIPVSIWLLLQSTQRTYSIMATEPMVPMSVQGVRAQNALYDTGGMYAAEESYAPAGIMIAPMSPPMYYNPSNDISDTREFLKTSYQAYLKTRDVAGLTRRAETTVRGSGGRVDSISSSDKVGYVSFAVPASKFEAFRDEVESFVGSRYISISIDSQNLLGQKQNIEASQKSAEEQLADAKAARAQIVSAHTKEIARLESERKAADAELNVLATEIGYTDNPYMYQQTSQRIDQLSYELSVIEGNISSENASYRANIESYDGHIAYLNDVLAGVKEEDKDFLNNVATVNGTISIQWISIWDIIQLYISAGWLALILLLAACLSYWWQRHGAKA